MFNHPATDNVETANPTDFHTTHWTVIFEAANGSAPETARDAVARLCSEYWYPLYAYVRRRGYEAHEAEDMTQEFFARFLQKSPFESLNPTKGKFRSFLLACLKHFLDNQWHKSHTQKRGGQYQIISWDAHVAENRYASIPPEAIPADQSFDRLWAWNVIDRVFNRLKEEYEEAGRKSQYTALQNYLSGGKNSASYKTMAAHLGMSEAAIKMAVHRLRHRFGVLLRMEVAQTVTRPEEIDEEIRYLLSGLCE